jgi:hypothetical protein
LWVTANLLADGDVTTEDVMTPTMIRAVLERLAAPDSRSVLREAAWVVKNAFEFGFVDPLIETGVCRALGAGLTHSQKQNPKSKIPQFDLIEPLLGALQHLVLNTVYDEHVVMDLAAEQVGQQVDELATHDNKKIRELAREFQPLMRRVAKLMTRPVGS